MSGLRGWGVLSKTHGLMRGFLGAPQPAEVGAASILFCHANGFCKEVWLPVVEELGDIFGEDCGLRVDWLLSDLPGHGDMSTDDLRDAAGWIESMSAHVAMHADKHMAGRPRRVGAASAETRARRRAAAQPSGRRRNVATRT